jgi:hypothetical protein
LKPKNERKPCPEAPKNFDDMLTGKTSSVDMESYNANAMKEYNDKALDACPNCARTFLPDRLIVHLRSCNKANGRADASPDPKGKSMGGGSLGGSMGGKGDRKGGSPPP